MARISSPTNRLGGKYFLRGWLTNMIPEHVCYVEPFAGAGHLLFGKPSSSVEVLNDIDGHLIGFFQVIKDPEKRLKLIETLQCMLYSRWLWEDIRSRWKAGDIPQDEVERVSWWFFLNRTCFGGDQQSGGFATPSTTGRNPIKSFRNAIKTFADVAERLRNVCIENLDYRECIRRYDSENTLFYCDPPYLGSEYYYEGGNFNQDGHYRLSEVLHEVKAKVMVSHYANGLYDDLYHGWQRVEYQSFKGSSKASSGESKPRTRECLWINFEPPLRNKTLLGF